MAWWVLFPPTAQAQAAICFESSSDLIVSYYGLQRMC